VSSLIEPVGALPRKILVAVEGSEPSLRDSSMKAAKYAIELATVSKAKLIALCVVQIPEYIEESTRTSLRNELFKKSKMTLSEIERLASEAKITFDSKTLETSGAIATMICSFSSKEGIELIVLGTRANTASLTKLMLGSVASGVAGNADCPVLVVR
jgi:nucleotide-binding universal stress UspA family protein